MQQPWPRHAMGAGCNCSCGWGAVELCGDWVGLGSRSSLHTSEAADGLFVRATQPELTSGIAAAPRNAA